MRYGSKSFWAVDCRPVKTATVKKMNSESITEELSPRAEIFRSKLIEDFQLLDIISSKGGVDAPKHYSNEVTG